MNMRQQHTSLEKDAAAKMCDYSAIKQKTLGYCFVRFSNNTCRYGSHEEDALRSKNHSNNAPCTPCVVGTSHIHKHQKKQTRHRTNKGILALGIQTAFWSIIYIAREIEHSVVCTCVYISSIDIHRDVLLPAEHLQQYSTAYVRSTHSYYSERYQHTCQYLIDQM